MAMATARMTTAITPETWSSCCRAQWAADAHMNGPSSARYSRWWPRAPIGHPEGRAMIAGS
eukprot:1774479-Pyramimonas_sp.AAC.1